MVGDLIICLLAFFDIFSSFYLFFFILKKGGPEGRVHVLSTPGWVNYMIVWVSAL